MEAETKEKHIRVAIPVYDEKGLDDTIYEHFGRSPYFLLIDIVDGEITGFKTVRNEHLEAHEPGQLPELLATHGVRVLICHRVGRKAISFLNQLGIQVVTGASGKVRNAVEAFLSGALKPTSNIEYGKHSREHRHSGE
jgi:predicted Fe-Mo cluster-binding NifX family protein